MIRRILEDSYKPLRVKVRRFLLFPLFSQADPFFSASQGFVKPIPKPTPFPAQHFATDLLEPLSDTPPTADSDAPPRPLHPWEYEYKAPAHYNPPPGYRVRTSVAPGSSKKKAVSTGEKGTAKAAVVKRARLASAYERTLDYKVGVRPSELTEDDWAREEHDASQLGPATMSAWGGVAEAKIQQAIRQGMLKDIKGRGKPIERDDAESNPFISRCVVIPFLPFSYSPSFFSFLPRLPRSSD